MNVNNEKSWSKKCPGIFVDAECLQRLANTWETKTKGCPGKGGDVECMKIQ